MATVNTDTLGISELKWAAMGGFNSDDHCIYSPGEGNGNPLKYACLENPMNSMKRINDSILKEELPRSVSAQYATGDQWRNNYRKNGGMEPK